MRTKLLAGLTMACVVGCGANESAPSVTTAAPRGIDQPTGPKTVANTSQAVVLHDHTLVLLAPDGKRKVIGALPGAMQCDADPAHGVIWLLGASLWVFETDTDKLVEVATNTQGSFNWGVSYEEAPPGPIKTTGRYDDDHDCAALMLSVSEKPTLRGAFIGDTADPPCEEREEEYKASIASYNKARLTDSGYVASLGSRRAHSNTKLAPPRGVAPKVAVDLPACKGSVPPCGTATHVGGSVWRINTGDSMGDVAHVHYQLYDSSTKLFWNPKNDKRSPTPLSENEELYNDVEGGIEGLSVAPSRDWAIYENKRLSLSPATVLGDVEGTVCGWK